jgi:hypothetical protein
MALDWKVVHGGKTPPPGEVVRPDERLSWGRTVGLGARVDEFVEDTSRADERVEDDLDDRRDER